MSSELDLRGLDRAHDPDPAFVERLRLRLVAASTDAAAAATAGDDLERVEQAITPASLVDLDDRRPRRLTTRTIVGLAAAIALVVAVAGVAITTGNDDTLRVSPRADERWPQGAQTKLFDLGFGDHVALPPAPIHDWTSPTAGWTGTELLLWSEGKGVAFDAAKGTWRTIAGAPTAAGGSVAGGDAFWTGTEMIVGSADGPRYQGAAYNPTSDTWRLLPVAPIGGDQTSDAPGVWTGKELVVFGSLDHRAAAAAYDPARDQWRRFADPPFEVDADPIWTGRSILARSTSGGTARYDIDADRWTTIRGVYAALVGAADADGSARTVLGVPAPFGPNTPIDVLDRDGRVVGTLPAATVDPNHFGAGSRVLGAMWVGGEAVLVLHGVHGGPCCNPEVWALDPVAERWHQLPEYEQVSALAAGDVVFIWSRYAVDPYGFVAYRIHR